MSKIIPISFKIDCVNNNAMSIFDENVFKITISYIDKSDFFNIKVKGEIFSLLPEDIKNLKYDYQNYYITSTKVKVYKKIDNFIVKFLLTKQIMNYKVEYKVFPININKVTLGGLIKLWIFKKRQKQ